MPKLEFRLFGGLEIHANGNPIEGLVSRKANALVAYLACNPSLHARERLADLLWDDRNPSSALGNLRVLLNSIRNQLVPPVVITRNTVHISQSEDIWVDCLAFEELVTVLTLPATQKSSLPPAIVDDLQNALALYQGEFLAGFHLREAQQFDDWATLERERYHILAVKSVQTLVSHYLSTNQHGLAVAAAQRWIQFDPFNEYAHRLLMEGLVNNGQRSAALDHYQHYLTRLRNEGLDPAVALDSLYQEISRDALTAKAEALQAEIKQNTLAISDGSQSLVPHNLPFALTPLIGRAAELTTIQARLEDQHCRLLTILGLGGVGKTHLAIEAAHQLAKSANVQTLFRDGIYLLRLDRIEPDQLLPSVIAGAINFTFQGALDQQAQLFHYLRGRHMLLLLDNFEHLLHHADFLDALLQQAPHVKALVTSRERLEFMGEWLLPIEGLPSPPEQPDSSTTMQDGLAAEWHEYPAPQLFIHTAKALQPAFAPAQQEAAIIEICETVEGLPLGIQLSAAAVHTHSCQEIATAIRRNLDFINTKMRNMPERHRSLRAAFEHSWILLTTEEQHAFGKLAVFVDGFSEETAHLVADITNDTLSQFGSKSLLQQLENPAESDPKQRYRRYRLHPVLHRYAAQQLTGMVEHEEQLRDRHCRYFCRFIADREATLNSMSAGEAADAIALELENVRASWRHALTHRLDELLLVMVPALIRFYLLRGYLQDALAMLESAINEVSTWLIAAEGQQQKQAQTDKTAYQTLLANLYVHSAEIYTELGQYEEALVAAQRAIDHAQQGEDAVGDALGHLQWGIALTYHGDYRQARQKLQIVLDLTQKHGLPSIEALAQRHMGVSSFYQGDYTGGRLQHEAAIRYYQQTENLFQELRTYHSLAMHYFFTGDFLQAKRHYERCLQVYQEVGDRPTTSLTLNNLGAISTQLGDYAAAQHSFEEALEIRRRIGDRQMEGLILANLGLLMHLMNNHQGAVDYCTQALEVSLDIGEQDTEAYSRACLAHAQLELGLVPDAITNYELAVGMRKSAGQHTQMLEPLAGLARAYLRLREPQPALQSVEEILPNLDLDTNAGIVELIRIY